MPHASSATNCKMACSACSSFTILAGRSLWACAGKLNLRSSSALKHRVFFPKPVCFSCSKPQVTVPAHHQKSLSLATTSFISMAHQWCTSRQVYLAWVGTLPKGMRRSQFAIPPPEFSQDFLFSGLIWAPKAAQQVPHIHLHDELDPSFEAQYLDFSSVHHPWQLGNGGHRYRQRKVVLAHHNTMHITFWMGLAALGQGCKSWWLFSSLFTNISHYSCSTSDSGTAWRSLRPQDAQTQGIICVLYRYIWTAQCLELTRLKLLHAFRLHFHFSPEAWRMQAS